MYYDVGIVKAFTSDNVLTLGNPAGIMIVPIMPDISTMQSIAVNVGQPMTAFVCPRSQKNDGFDIRYYDLGGRECHICGHATVAATSLLAQLNPKINNNSIVFHLNPKCFNGKEKQLITRVENNKISIDLFPSILRHEKDDVLLEAVASVLNISAIDIASVAFSTNIKDYVVGIKDHKVLLNMKPDFFAMKKMAESGSYQHEGMMVSSPAPEGGNYDLYVRAFLPITGVNEDIACGSCNCSIIPYWYDLNLNRNTRAYRTVFPFPEGPKGFVGGIQHVGYVPEQQKITITAQAEFDGYARVSPTVVRSSIGLRNFVL